MTRTIKTILFLLIAAMAAYLAWVKWKPAAFVTPTAGTAVASEPEYSGPSPFKGLGLKYDGFYRAFRGSIFYLIRFYPEGRAVLINGTKEMEKELPKFLTRETQGNPVMGLYNVMVDVRGDSLFFKTHPMKGEIDYGGKVMNPSMVQFHRHSHINGVRYDMQYFFMPDTADASAQ